MWNLPSGHVTTSNYQTKIALDEHPHCGYIISCGIQLVNSNKRTETSRFLCALPNHSVG